MTYCQFLLFLQNKISEMKFEEVIEKKIINEKIQGDVLEIHNKISGGKKLYNNSYGR